MSKLTKEAKRRDCQVRIPGICNHNPETTVLAHYRMVGTCGTGIKPNDFQGAWCCSSCHDETDGRTRNYNSDDPNRMIELKLFFAEGVMRTQAILIKEGKVAA